MNGSSAHHYQTQAPAPISFARPSRYPITPVERPKSTPIPITPQNPASLPDSPTSSAPSELDVNVDSEGEMDPRDIWELQKKGKKVLFLDLRVEEAEGEKVKGEVVKVDLGVWSGREE